MAFKNRFTLTGASALAQALPAQTEYNCWTL